MKQILSDYFAIVGEPAWSKSAKKAKSAKYQKWQATEYDDLPTYQEMNDFIQHLNAHRLSYDSWFFLHKIYFPVISVEIEQKNLQAVKEVLFKHGDAFWHFKHKQNQELNLLQLGLQIDGTDVDLLHYSLSVKDRYYAFTIHEVPWGVLYDMNGASVAQTRELLQDLNDYEALAQSLDCDRTDLIEQCRFYYDCWITYLLDTSVYGSFEALINAKKQ